jgi:hypothetical protein
LLNTLSLLVAVAVGSGEAAVAVLVDLETALLEKLLVVVVQRNQH